MKFTVAAIASAALLSQAVSASVAPATRVERRETLRKLYARQNYPGEPTVPSCEADYDTQTSDGCQCGPGRIQTTDDLCVTPIVEGQYEIFPLEGPSHVSVGFTVSGVFTASAELLDVNQCAAIAVSERPIGAIGFYYEPTEGGNADCWLLAFSGVYASPSTRPNGFPFIADGATRLAKRGVQETGSVGSAGGSLAFDATAADDGSATVGCLEEFDTRNQNGTCDCGAGRVRVEGSTTECRFAASVLARRAAKRAVAFGEAKW